MQQQHKIHKNPQPALVCRECAFNEFPFGRVENNNNKINFKKKNKADRKKRERERQ